MTFDVLIGISLTYLEFCFYMFIHETTVCQIKPSESESESDCKNTTKSDLHCRTPRQ